MKKQNLITRKYLILKHIKALILKTKNQILNIEINKYLKDIIKLKNKVKNKDNHKAKNKQIFANSKLHNKVLLMVTRSLE